MGRPLSSLCSHGVYDLSVVFLLNSIITNLFMCMHILWSSLGPLYPKSQISNTCMHCRQRLPSMRSTREIFPHSWANLYLQSVLHFRQIFVVFSTKKRKVETFVFSCVSLSYFLGIIWQISGITKLKFFFKNLCLQCHCKLGFPCPVPKISSQWLFCFTTHCSTH